MTDPDRGVATAPLPCPFALRPPREQLLKLAATGHWLEMLRHQKNHSSHFMPLMRFMVKLPTQAKSNLKFMKTLEK